MLTQEGYSNKYAPQDGYSNKMHQMLTQEGYSNKYAPNECWHKKVIPTNMHQMNVDTRWLFQ